MIRSATVLLGFLTLLYIAPSAALAQNVPPSYQADPDVYKVIFEDQNFRVIASTRKVGVTDKPHSHPVPSVIYFINDCMTRLRTPDGKTVENKSKAGTAGAVPITANHTAENIGTTDCHTVFVERK